MAGESLAAPFRRRKFGSYAWGKYKSIRRSIKSETMAGKQKKDGHSIEKLLEIASTSKSSARRTTHSGPPKKRYTKCVYVVRSRGPSSSKRPPPGAAYAFVCFAFNHSGLRASARKSSSHCRTGTKPLFVTKATAVR
ncbi:hypothetical protein TcasGA2_TC004318 [Tribolium castaneum]|uniref:Uncharacterized protein n=1 Tax=Tribolium castaneum TaxID=7070 RepID=D6X127_TRICA|nr:hypothetical protein TcasGA2_TC004318 [Tribolium castaneum]